MGGSLLSYAKSSCVFFFFFFYFFSDIFLLTSRLKTKGEMAKFRSCAVLLLLYAGEGFLLV